MEAEVVGVVVSGSRCRGIEKVGSDLDVVLEYKGNVREDAFFDIFHEDGMEISGVKVDDRGKSLMDVLDQLCVWGEKNRE